MWLDPIVSETRLLREEYAAQFDHDLNAIFEDILKRQARTERRLVNYEPRRSVAHPATGSSPTEAAR
jgi:hypothetical protein